MKKHNQLGMNASTASGRLVKDLLFDFVYKAGYVCFRCGLPMSRPDFSIEHKIEWLDSDNPVQLFFDIENIAYSHKSCNYKAARKPQKIHKDRKAACASSAKNVYANRSIQERQRIRREKYQKYGC